jgi:hypothetical protein
MDIFTAICMAVGGIVLGFGAGRASVQYPPEDEMIRRLKELRYNRKLEREASAEVDQELGRPGS